MAMLLKFDKDAYISEILNNLARNSEWAPFLAAADTYQETQTGFKAIYKRVGTMGVGDYYNNGENKYRVSNKEGETNSYVQNIEIDVDIKKSSEMYYSATEYAGFKSPDEIFVKQRAKQEKDWMRMHDIEVLTLITKGGTGKSEQATTVPVDVTEFDDGKKLRKYISERALTIKRKGLITEDNEHVGINSSDIVVGLAPQQFSMIIENYALIDNSTLDLREDIRATKVDGILVYENLYLDAILEGNTDKSWMVMGVKNRLALPTAIEGTYDNVVFKADHVLGMFGVMGKGILDGSLITRFTNIAGIKPEWLSLNKDKTDEVDNLKDQLKNQKEEVIKIKTNSDKELKALKEKLEVQDKKFKTLEASLKEMEKAAK